jgi:hypothetical protein
VEGANVLGATPSDTIVAESTKFKSTSGLEMDKELFSSTVEVLSPPVGTRTINNSLAGVATGNALVEGLSQLAQPIASSTIPPDDRYESTGQISDISPNKVEIKKMMRTTNKVIRGTKFPLMRLRGNIFQWL